MKIELLPTTFDSNGRLTAQQHLACFVFDDSVAIDAGSLAWGLNDKQRQAVRDVIVSHAHLDHIAGLPIFVDDLFAELQSPLRVHATPETIEILENHIFNWQIYPRFSELKNDFGEVMTYLPFAEGKSFQVKDLEVTAIQVNHQVSTVGLIVEKKSVCVAYTSDTAKTEKFWDFLNELPRLDALFIECAFPDRMQDLAVASHHLTPRTLQIELAKLKHDCTIYAVNLKPMYREEICRELEKINIKQIEVMLPRKTYEF